jgi:hypothetical protein
MKLKTKEVAEAYHWLVDPNDDRLEPGADARARKTLLAMLNVASDAVLFSRRVRRAIDDRSTR